LAVISVAMIWPPPPRLSTTTCWPSASVSRTASILPTMSPAPPGGYGTMSRMARCG
jgi:hypothetical protein